MEDRKEILSCRDRFRWREWLSQHFVSETEVWLVFPGKSTEEEGVSYNDAVEEALCFGWIEAARKRPDEFEKRLENFIRKTREGKVITGYGGMKTPLPCSAVAPKEVVSFGGHKTLTYF